MMHLLLFTLLCLCCFVQGTTINATTPTCLDLLTEGTYRSVWDILGTCALTLIICLWHTIHFDVPRPQRDWVVTLRRHVSYIVGGFLAPEWFVGVAAEQWIRAHKCVMHFHERGYEWSMTHSYFAEAGGFVYQPKEGNVEVIKARGFLELCKAGKIANPLLTEDDIKDRSKSDTVSKAIFAIQLFWFVLQVSVRHFMGLVVTLVELDTLCMAVIAVFYLFVWWKKPLNATFSHVFYENQEAKVYLPEELSKAWQSQPGFLSKLWRRPWMVIRSILRDEENLLPNATDGDLIHILKTTTDRLIQNTDPTHANFVGRCVTWCVLGALHLGAWNYEFVTEKEMWIWRAAALGLTGGAPVAIIFSFLLDRSYWSYMWKFLIVSSVICRMILAVLMLLSLRALPLSAHQIIPWTEYIPHL